MIHLPNLEVLGPPIKPKYVSTREFDCLAYALDYLLTFPVVALVNSPGLTPTYTGRIMLRVSRIRGEYTVNMYPKGGTICNSKPS